MQTYLDFEKPIAELEAQARAQRSAEHPNEGEAARLDERARRLLDETYHRLTPWQKTQVARAPGRPRMMAIAAGLLDGFTPLAGDRAFGDDPAIVGGLGSFRGRAVMAIGHEKGHDTATRVQRNFGMARPEGYRKAARLMRMADRFGVPVLSFVDTPGAYPGVDAEERGQAEAIARATEACLELTVPSVAVIVGEGGSGGAIALAAASRVLMLEHAVYSVISPEGCASILWKEGGAGKIAEAADAMKLTAADLLRLHVIDRIVREPAGGAHRDPAAAIVALGDAVEAALAGMDGLSAEVLRFNRRAKFLAMGRMA